MLLSKVLKVLLHARVLYECTPPDICRANPRPRLPLQTLMKLLNEKQLGKFQQVETPDPPNDMIHSTQPSLGLPIISNKQASSHRGPSNRLTKTQLGKFQQVETPDPPNDMIHSTQPSLGLPIISNKQASSHRGPSNRLTKTQLGKFQQVETPDPPS
jgi:hypothetical protein